LALARRLTVSIGIRGGPALRLGFGLGRARDSGPDCAALGGCRLLPPRAQSHVRGLRRGLDRTVDCLRNTNPPAIAAVAAVALGVYLFVILYEEPTLCRKFGAQLDCRNVRWWPRTKGWDKPE
jgi:hypothetical protein